MEDFGQLGVIFLRVERNFPVLLEFVDYSLIVNALFSWLKALGTR
jgi:hypothetical protein